MSITRHLAALCVALFVLLGGLPALAQTSFVSPGGGQVDGKVQMCLNSSNQAVPCSDSSAIASKVSGTFSASGFQSNGVFANLTATASSSASTALPSGATAVRITNTGSGTVSCTFATGAATGLVNNIQVGPSSSVSRVVGSFDHIACIDQTGSSGSQLVVVEGGSGLGNDTGGGSSSGGGTATTGFTPNGNFASLTSTASTSASTALPATSTVVDIVNTGTSPVSCVPATGAATGLISHLQVMAAGGHTPFVVGAYDHIACINQNGDAASNVVVLEGGAGLANTAGGGPPVTQPVSGTVAASNFPATVDTNTGNAGASTIRTVTAANDPLLTTATTILPSTAWNTNTYTNGTVSSLNTDLHGAPWGDIGAVAGAAVTNNSVPVINGGNTYNTVAASQTTQALTGGSGGATGDYLSHCVVQPITTAAGTVTIFDNATSVFVFTTGTLSNLVPFAIPIGARSVSGAWKVTTGANETVTCVGKFT